MLKRPKKSVHSHTKHSHTKHSHTNNSRQPPKIDNHHRISKTNNNSNNRNNRNNRNNNKVRIIGGQFKSRQIQFVSADGLRPTPDRLRETLFNWLMGHLNDANVLDMCAGSGILGFEALSRGAKHVTFIEPNPTQNTQLQRTISQLTLGDDKVTVINATAQHALTTALPHQFDLVFIDPPYSLNLWQTLLDLLIKQKCLQNNGLIYLEANSPLEQVMSSWQQADQLQIMKHKKVGQIFAYLMSIK